MEKTYIPIEQCVKYGLYKIYSRNLTLGVYDGNGGFVGIREKFGDEYLFTEYHWDTGEPFGTVMPLELIEICSIEPTEDMYIDNKLVNNLELFNYLQVKHG